MPQEVNHQNNFATNLTSNQTSGVTTTPLNSIPSIAAPFYIALDATNINSKYEVVLVTSKTATNINHAATTYAHTTAEEVRMVVPAEELDALNDFLIAGATGANGWVAVTGTWTYASATTITVPAGAASIYNIGDKIWLTQTTSKYFYVTAVADTLLTVTGGSDYTVANAAITAPYYSKAENPLGFPGYFNFAPARAVSAGTAPTYTALDIAYFTINGTMLFADISWANASGGTAGAGGAALTFTLPVACKSADFVADRNHLGMGLLFESAGTICGVSITGATGATTAEFANITSAATITGNDQSSTSRFINASLQYRIA